MSLFLCKSIWHLVSSHKPFNDYQLSLKGMHPYIKKAPLHGRQSFPSLGIPAAPRTVKCLETLIYAAFLALHLPLHCINLEIFTSL